VPDKHITWTVVAMPADEMPVTITVPEFAKRMHMMTSSVAVPSASLALQATINANHPLAQKLLRSKKEEKQLKLAQQAYQVALLAQDMLNGSERTNFIQNNIGTLLSV